MSDSASRDIAVIGYSCRFAAADNVGEFWKNIVEGKDGFREIPKDRWDHDLFYSEHSREHDKTYVTRGAFMDDITSFAAMHFGVAPRRVESMDPQHRMILDGVRVALQDAGLEKGGYDASMVGTFLGVSTSEYRNLVTSRTMGMLMTQGKMGAKTSADGDFEIGHALENIAPIGAFSMPGTLLNMTAANVAHQWKLGGPAYTVDAACASSLVAVHDAITNIRAGICDMALAGGVYLNLTPESLIGFSRIGAISRSGECRPFDEKADGFLQGDGCGVLVLKRLDLALADGNRIHAVIRGTGINNDADTSGPMAPAIEGQADVIQRAYRDARIDSTAGIDYVECHGTATAVGDPVEVSALRQVFGEDGPDIHIGSVKGNVGHTMSAAGVAGLLKAILAVEHGQIPMQPGFETPHEALELEDSRFKVARESHEWKSKGPRRAAVSAFGFGGTNCHMLIEQAPEVETTAATGPQLIVLTAGNHELLASHAREVAEHVRASDAELSDIAFSLSASRQWVGARLAVIVESTEELAQKLEDVADCLVDASSTVLAPDVFVTSGGAAPKLAFMFPGQGAQRLGLLRDAYDQFEGFRERVDALAASVEEHFEKPLTHYLYPDLAHEPFDLEKAEAALTATEICQPAMALLGLALDQFVREDLGLEADFTLGHSLGEFVAVGAAGMLTPEETLRFVTERGRLMAELELEDQGAMVAVMGDESAVEPHLDGFDAVQIANLNHPQQTVVSGATEQIKKLAEMLESKGVKATVLRVSHAFHSPVIAGVTDDLRKVTDTLEFSSGHSQAISAIDVAAYSTESATATFVRHATAPVNFIGALRAAREDGANYFVEIGAGTTLIRCALKTLEGVDARSLGSTEADANREFLRTLGHLVASGAEIDLHGLMNKTDRPRLVSLPATPLETQSYWIVRDRETPLAIAEEAEAHRQNTQGDPMSSTKSSMNDSKTTNDGLVSLFQQQNEILRQHAQIMAAQTAMLNGKDVDLKALQLLNVDANGGAPRNGGTPHADGDIGAPANGSARVNGAAPHADGDIGAPANGSARSNGGAPVDYSEVVYTAVANVSAFPADALKDGQQLAGDLGFDSLMFVDLATALQRDVPGLGEIPQDAFNQKTTIGEVIAFLNDNVSTAVESAEPEAVESTTNDERLQRYAPVWVEHARPQLPERAVFENLKLVLVSDEAAPKKLVAALEQEDVEIVTSTVDAAEDALVDADADGLLWWAGNECEDELELYWRAHRLAKTLAEVSETPRMFAILTSVGHDKLVAGAAPWANGLAAFTQSLTREWTDTRIKYVDTTDDFEEAVRELRTPAKDVAIHYDGSRWLQALEERPFGAGGPEFSEDDVIVFTGGASGIGALLAGEIATRSNAGLVIVGRTAEGDLGDRAKSNLESMRKAGSKVEYVSWDVSKTAPSSLGDAFDTLGKPTALIHSAGVIRDREVSAKSESDVRTVTSVKTTGFDNVYATVAEHADDLNLVLAFTSWAGIFGNRSQTDYAAANAALDARIVALRHAGVHAASIAWPAWESSEMVQSIPAPVRDAMRKKGVTFITDEAGIQAFFHELLTADEASTAVYGVNLPTEIRSVRTRFDVSVDSHPYLQDHVLKDKPVMPFAAALDYVATAGLQTLGEAPPFAIEDFTLQRGIEADKPLTLQLTADGESRGKRHEAKIEVKALVEGAPQPYAAYGGRLVTGAIDGLLELVPESRDTQKGPDSRLPLDLFYSDFAFHGPSLQAITAIEEVGEAHAIGRLKTSKPADLLNDPVRDAWTVDPRVIDGAMQLTLYYLQSRHGMAAFPTGFASYVQLRPITEDEVRVTLVKHELDDTRVVGSLRIESLDGEPIAVMSRLTARVFEFEKKLPSEAEDDGPEVNEEHWNVAKFPEVEALEQRLQMADLMGIANPYFAVHDGIAKNKAIINGKEMINFSSYNYLGFSGHPNVSQAAKEAVDRYGTSVSASRLASGQIPLHQELEEAIADFMGVDAALVFSAGHHTNESVIGHLFNEGDLIIHDSLAHNSILTGAELSGAKRMKFPHNDHVALEKLLKQLRGSYNKVGIMIEGVYSMDGDIPDLPAFIALKKKYKCLLYVDEAHSAGCIGSRGAGVADYFGLDPMEVDVWMGTLSKSFSSCGGYCAGSAQLIQYLKYTVPGFIFSAGISPANAAAALAAVQLLAANPDVPKRLQARSEYFLQRCKANGLDTGPSADSAVVPVIVGNSMECLQLSESLAKRGINVQPIVYPAVDDDAARLRFFMSATHEEDELAFTADTIAEELNRIQSGAAAE